MIVLKNVKLNNGILYADCFVSDKIIGSVVVDCKSKMIIKQTESSNSLIAHYLFKTYLAMLEMIKYNKYPKEFEYSWY